RAFFGRGSPGGGAILSRPADQAHRAVRARRPDGHHGPVRRAAAADEARAARRGGRPRRRRRRHPLQGGGERPARPPHALVGVPGHDLNPSRAQQEARLRPEGVFSRRAGVAAAARVRGAAAGAAKTVQEFVDYAKANPGKLNFGASLGTPPHLMGALFTRLAKLDMTFIPYKGAAPSIADMLGGQTHMQFDALTTLYPLIAEGKLRALAVTSAQRWPALPDVPTMIESGFPTFPQNAWSGVLAPANTPASVTDKLNATINESLQTSEAKAALLKLSAVTKPGSPRDFSAFMAEQAPIWAELVRMSGASIQ